MAAQLDVLGEGLVEFGVLILVLRQLAEHLQALFDYVLADDLCSSMPVMQERQNSKCWLPGGMNSVTYCPLSSSACVTHTHTYKRVCVQVPCAHLHLSDTHVCTYICVCTSGTYVCTGWHENALAPNLAQNGQICEYYCYT